MDAPLVDEAMRRNNGVRRRPPSARCRDHPQKPRLSLIGHPPSRTGHRRSRPDARSARHLRPLSRCTVAHGAAAVDRGPMAEPRRKSIIAHRPLRRGPCAGSRMGVAPGPRQRCAQEPSATTGRRRAAAHRPHPGHTRTNGRENCSFRTRICVLTAKMQLLGTHQLRVSGCAVGKSLRKSPIWTRADGPLPS